MWADVGNHMYGYVGSKLDLVSAWKEHPYSDASEGDVIEVAYNLYYMHAVLSIDIASLLGVSEEKLIGWWAQINMIQRDGREICV